MVTFSCSRRSQGPEYYTSRSRIAEGTPQTQVYALEINSIDIQRLETKSRHLGTLWNSLEVKLQLHASNANCH